MLKIENLSSGYRKKQVVFDLSLNVDDGEVVALIGPNGAGKSTVLKTICGLTRAWSGTVQYNGVQIQRESPSENVKRGLVFVPQGNRVFAELTVLENLQLGGYHLSKQTVANSIATSLDLFPILSAKLNQYAGSLSGGEQQILALARVLVSRPKFIMFDEPSLGLSPSLIHDVLDQISKLVKEKAHTILIVEQKVQEVLRISDRVYSMKLGRLEYSGQSKELLNDKDKLRSLFL